MADKQFNSYNLANSIDPVNDLLLIYNKVSGTLENISRNTYLALASAPLGLTDTQSPTNKAIGITNTITVLDTLFTLQDNGDNTKQLQFQLSSITTATTRTLTIPNISSTIATIGGSQTFSGTNSFTGSSWTGGTISNTAIAADTITGFTSSTSGNIYGIAVTSGVITGASTVGSAALATNAVQANQIATTAITLSSISSSTSQSGISTSPVIITGLTTTVTIPAGGRKVRIEAYLPAVSSTSISGVVLSIYNSATVTGTPVQNGNIFMSTANTANSIYTFYEYTPSAGSQSYCAGVLVATGTGSTGLASTILAYLTVKLV